MNGEAFFAWLQANEPGIDEEDTEEQTRPVPRYDDTQEARAVAAFAPEPEICRDMQRELRRLKGIDED